MTIKEGTERPTVTKAPVLNGGVSRVMRGLTFFWHLTRPYGPFFGSIAVIAVVWQVVGSTYDLLVVPPVTEIIAAFWSFLVDGTFVDPLANSLSVLGAGLVISMTSGILMGALMGISRRVDWAFGPYVDAMLMAPMIAFVPVFMIVFGLGFGARLAVVVLYSVFAVIINTRTGMRAVDKSLVEMGRSFGATRQQLLWRIRIPGALPYIMGGVQIGSSRALKGLIMGEVLIAIVGLGGLVERYGTAFNMPNLYALIFFLLILATVIRWLTLLLTRWCIGRLSGG